MAAQHQTPSHHLEAMAERDARRAGAVGCVQHSLLRSSLRFTQTHTYSMAHAYGKEKKMGEQLWDGTLSGEEFRAAAFFLMDVWVQCFPDLQHWRWQDCSSSDITTPDTGRGYLVLEDILVDPERNSEASVGDYHFYTYHVVYSDSYRVPKLFFRGCFPDGKSLRWEDIKEDLPITYEADNEHMRWTILTQEEHPYLHRPWFVLHPCETSSMMSMIFHWRLGETCSTQAAFSSQSLTTLAVQKASEWSDGSNKSEYVKGGSEILSNPQFSTADLTRVNIIQHYVLTWLSFAGQAAGLRLPSGFNKCFLKLMEHTVAPLKPG